MLLIKAFELSKNICQKKYCIKKKKDIKQARKRSCSMQ